MKWQAKAPANLALIKYMGKIDSSENRPTNASLSFTLDHLCTSVELEECSTGDRWEPLDDEVQINLSESGQQRFLHHLERIKKVFGYDGHFIVRSGNNFPSDCGLASSSSSFAALTKCACEALQSLTENHGNIDLNSEKGLRWMSQLSQSGSGSSCRSFFSPWAIWRGEGAEPILLSYDRLFHFVVIVESGKKDVSSSQAHRRVMTSLNFNGRVDRTEKRLDKLITALKISNWHEVFEISWNEFWDMHSLFETSNPPFGYMTEKSFTVLQMIRKFWLQNQDGPVVTMDAGSNVHLLFRPDQIDIYKEMKKNISMQFRVI